MILVVVGPSLRHRNLGDRKGDGRLLQVGGGLRIARRRAALRGGHHGLVVDSGAGVVVRVEVVVAGGIGIVLVVLNSLVERSLRRLDIEAHRVGDAVLKRVVVGHDRPRHGAISRNRRLRGVIPRRGLAVPGLRVREARGLSILGGAVGAHDPAGQPVVNRHVGILSRLGDLLINGLEDVVQLAGIRGGLVVAAGLGAVTEVGVPRLSPQMLTARCSGIRVVAGDAVHVLVQVARGVAGVGTADDADRVDGRPGVLQALRLVHRGGGDGGVKPAAVVRLAVGEEDDDLLRVGARLIR